MTRRFFVCILLLSFLATPAFAGEKPWTEARSAHFRVITNGSSGDARKVLREFEQIRWVFSTRIPGARLDSGAPLTVFATRDEETAKTLDPFMWKRMGEFLAGAFHTGWEKQYAMVRLDTWGGDGARQVVYHEYTHSVLRLNSHYLPLWLNEGLAEFYGYTRFEEHRIYLGAPTERYKTLRSRTPIPVQTLISMSRMPADEQMFYTQAWALVHFLIYGPGMENGKRMDKFFGLLQQAIPQDKAFEQSFGDFRSVDKGLASYVQQPTFLSTILKDPPQIDDKAVTFRPLTIAETEAELGGFHLWTRDRDGARPLLEQALKDDPKLGLAHENMGFLDFDEGKEAEAASEFAQAYALDSHRYLALFAKTMVSPLPASRTVSDMNTFGATMGKVLQENPHFAPAYVQLARLAMLENDLDSALLMSRKAEESEPSLAGYHTLSGQILRRMGKGAEAAASAEFVAERWTGPDHNEAVELWNSIPAAQRPAGQVLFDIVPKDTQVVEGKVKSVTCAPQEQGWAFVLDQGGQLLTFHRKGGFAAGFSDTIWYGTDHFSLCHHLEGMRAIVHYHAPADASYAGDAVEFEIRDDLAEPVKEAAAASATQ